MYSALDVVMEKYNLSYADALDFILLDYNVMDSQINYAQPVKRIYQKKEEPPEIIYVTKKFNQKELDYWKSFGISKNTLDYFDVKAVSYYTLKDKRKVHITSKDKPIFAYEVNKKVKLYSPYGDVYEKWCTNISTEIQGYKQLTYTSDLLIITKSLKDVMVLYELGIEAIALNSEMSFIEETVFNSLKEKYKHIVLLLDNDDTGKKASVKHSLAHNIPYYIFSDKLKLKNIKDCADFAKTFSKQALLKNINRNVYSKYCIRGI